MKEQCTPNILASIEAGSTTIEGWEQYCARFEQKPAIDIDEYMFETYQGAQEALSLLAGQQQAQEG